MKMNKPLIIAVLSVLFVFAGPASALILSIAIYLAQISIWVFNIIFRHVNTHYVNKRFVTGGSNQLVNKTNEFDLQAVNLRKKIAEARLQMVD
jgi:hypothetical protein